MKFGTEDSSVVKLNTIYDYANFYTSALKPVPGRSWNFRLTYLDAFAGSGRFVLGGREIDPGITLPISNDTEDFSKVVEGSAIRALRVDNPFDKYIFSDTKRSNVTALSEMKTEFPHLSDRIEITHSDANDVVKAFCSRMKQNDRAMVFLDPFGNQVDFETLRVIANTGKIDLWYLFPSWWGIVRQITNDGRILADAEASLARVFGTKDYRDELVKLRSMPDLLEPDRKVWEKIADADSVTRYMIKRMQTIFGQGVSERWLPLGQNGAPGYSLIFACANQKDRARKLAFKVASHVMSRS